MTALNRSTGAPGTGAPASETVLGLGGGRALRFHRRALLVAAGLLAVGLVVGIATLLTGSYEISAIHALRTLVGEGSELDRFIVLDQRLPRVLAAAVIGAMLAVSGALFQSLSRNPLGSPDIVGFTSGATTGGLLVILISSASSLEGIAVGATLGGMVTAAVVVLVAMRRGGTGGSSEEIILAGIAISQMLSSANDYLLSRATIEDAEVAKAWQYGSLNAIRWEQVAPLLAIGLALALPVLFLGRPGRMLEMGDDAAVSLGLGANQVRLMMIGAGVVISSVCVSVAGPIGFLALAAPQLAQRLCRSSGLVITSTAAMGAALLLVADLVAQRLLAPFQIPVGLVSAACGGMYLVWLLGVRRERTGE